MIITSKALRFGALLVTVLGLTISVSAMNLVAAVCLLLMLARRSHIQGPDSVESRYLLYLAIFIWALLLIPAIIHSFNNESPVFDDWWKYRKLLYPVLFFVLFIELGYEIGRLSFLIFKFCLILTAVQVAMAVCNWVGILDPIVIPGLNLGSSGWGAGYEPTLGKNRSSSGYILILLSVTTMVGIRYSVNRTHFSRPLLLEACLTGIIGVQISLFSGRQAPVFLAIFFVTLCTLYISRFFWGKINTRPNTSVKNFYFAIGLFISFLALITIFTPRSILRFGELIQSTQDLRLIYFVYAYKALFSASPDLGIWLIGEHWEVSTRNVNRIFELDFHEHKQFHSDLLNLTLKFGIIGLISYIIYTTQIVRIAVFNIKYNKNSSDLLCLSALIISTCIMSIFTNQIYDFGEGHVVSFVYGYALWIAYQIRRDRRYGGY